jgi:hypothetical protein
MNCDLWHRLPAFAANGAAGPLPSQDHSERDFTAENTEIAEEDN